MVQSMDFIKYIPIHLESNDQKLTACLATT